ncbi:MAG: response regulator [Elusimicrobia bacterium]|nr:response regulator [Elusimicrobiota bacterium]
MKGAVQKKGQRDILLVDDDPNFQETLSDALSLKKVHLVGAASGTEALQKLQQVTPSLILLDVQLPDIHGFELCRVLRRSDRLRKTPIVFLSAKFTEPADRAEGLLVGGDAYLSKPIHVDSLWEEIDYLLDKAG